MNGQILTVSQANSYIKALLDHDMVLSSVFISGEISNFKKHYSGHMYLTLKDDKSVMKAVMFKMANSRLKFMPEDGMKVVIQGRISVYERGGQYQLYIEDMQPDGVGALHIAFEQLKEKLSKEGLFDEGTKKGIPRYPGDIGIVTSATGAAVRDILHILKRRFPYAKVWIYPVLVQGEQACEQIVEGIHYFNTHKKVDVIITGRGGGSIEELWAFNEEIVARAIAASDIPIISAVGHETDFTIADFVADLRAPTPSAAAELAVPSQYELREKIQTLASHLTYTMHTRIARKKDTLGHLTQAVSPRNLIDGIEQQRVLLDTLNKTLLHSIQMQINTNKEQLSALCGKLNTLSPLAVIARGYAVVKDENQCIIKSVSKVKKGSHIDVQLVDGNLQCKVEEVKHERA